MKPMTQISFERESAAFKSRNSYPFISEYPCLEIFLEILTICHNFRINEHTET